MIQFDRVSTEDVIRQSFMEDSRSISTVLNADENTNLEFTYTIRHKNISAKYAKAILKDYLTENLK
jgi:uncharacterized protein involved in exopolysaccharide biosynthesis